VTVEIERKFVPSQQPSSDVLGTGVRIRQGYLAEEGEVSVRIRFVEESPVLTVKAGGGLERTEVEVPISTDEANALWDPTAGRRVEKTRHRVVLSGGADLVAEVDLYAGNLAGLCTVEVEFVSPAAAADFRPPAWFGREVTGRSEWSNAALARDGCPADHGRA
jgi:adenylate cyclase